MKKLLVLLILPFQLMAQENVRHEIRIPDIPGYQTLCCDFHIHTVFSDGQVWPDVRVEEAWIEGLDAIAITDHIEYQPHKADVSVDRNRSTEIARNAVGNKDIIIIRGGEITRKMPPGHSNALFIKDVNMLQQEEWRKAFEEAARQGAFFIWNHPGWKVQQPDTVKWFPEHSEMLDKGWMQAIEIVNDHDYYPQAFQWALQKNLTILGNSDIHGPEFQYLDVKNGKHRPINLVFVKEKSEEGILEALKEHRTVVWFHDSLFGKEEYLVPLVRESIQVEKARTFRRDNTVTLSLKNLSDLDFILSLKEKTDASGIWTVPSKISLKAGSSANITLKWKDNKTDHQETVHVKYLIDNVLLAPGKNLEYIISF
jgi:hypothetical protein